jgi:hypothetical protein
MNSCPIEYPALAACKNGRRVLIYGSVLVFLPVKLGLRHQSAAAAEVGLPRDQFSFTKHRTELLRSLIYSPYKLVENSVELRYLILKQNETRIETGRWLSSLQQPGGEEPEWTGQAQMGQKQLT